MPAELRAAVESGWFPRRSAVLDIGCGDGRLSRWLADEGYDVVGIDFALAAVDKAKALHGDAGVRLSFTTMDFCRERPDRTFGALLDHGTLHLVERGLFRAYLRNAAAALDPGGRFLLVYPTVTRKKRFEGADAKRERIVGELRPLIEPLFKIERVRDTVLGSVCDGEPYARGVALRLVRRSRSVS